MTNRCQWASGRTAVIPGNGNEIGVSLGHACRYRAYAGLGNQLYRYQGIRVYLLEVENQLRQILDRVNIVMRRRRNQRDTWHRIPESRDQIVNLAARQLPALSGFGTLRHFNLQDFSINQVVWCDAKATRRDLLDLGDTIGAIPVRILTALTTVGASANLVHTHS